MRKVKCKYCEEMITKEEDKFVRIEETKTGKIKKINLHVKCKEEYEELIRFKENELHWFDEVIRYIEELLDYSNEQRLSSATITKIQDLRNGTVLKRGQGRVIKSKEGYKFEIIYDCLLTNGDNLRWAFKNKTFKKDSDKINYMMAVISNTINDSYELYQSRQRTNNRNNNDIIQEEIIINEAIKKIAPTIDKPKTGISKFLDEDDF